MPDLTLFVHHDLSYLHVRDSNASSLLGNKVFTWKQRTWPETHQRLYFVFIACSACCHVCETWERGMDPLKYMNTTMHAQARGKSVRVHANVIRASRERHYC